MTLYCGDDDDDDCTLKYRDSLWFSVINAQIFSLQEEDKLNMKLVWLSSDCTSNDPEKQKHQLNCDRHQGRDTQFWWVFWFLVKQSEAAR